MHGSALVLARGRRGKGCRVLFHLRVFVYLLHTWGLPARDKRGLTGQVPAKTPGL